MESPEAIQQETKSEKLGDMISDTFDEMESEEESTEEVELSSENETETEVEVEEEAEVEEVEASSEEVIEEVETLSEEIQDAADSGYNEPAPERWEQETKDYYNGLDPKGKEIFLDRMFKPMQRSYTKATQELSDMRKTIQPVMETMEKYGADFQRMGVDPIEGFRTQMAWVNYIQQVGAEKGLAEMAKAYGVKGGAPKAGQEKYLTPTERAQQARIDSLQNTVDGMQQTTQQTTKQNEQQQVERHGNEHHIHAQVALRRAAVEVFLHREELLALEATRPSLVDEEVRPAVAHEHP